MTVTEQSVPKGGCWATVVTNEAGAYSIGLLAAGRVTLRFQLEGFTTASLQVTVAESGATVNQRLAIAPQSETVMVYGQAPVLLPTPLPRPPAPRPRPPPPTEILPDHDRDSICGPARLGPAIESLGRLQSRRSAANRLYGQGDELVVWVEGSTGLAVGRNLVVRRSYRGDLDRTAPTAEHASGLVQIVEAGEFTSVAVVIYACDEMMPGDRLASFGQNPSGRPSRSACLTTIVPPDPLCRRSTASRHAPALMVINQGTRSAVRTGQRLTLFRGRRTRPGEVVIIGDAVVVATRGDSATIRVEQATDAILFGDWAAPQPAQPSQARSADLPARTPIAPTTARRLIRTTIDTSRAGDCGALSTRAPRVIARPVWTRSDTPVPTTCPRARDGNPEWFIRDSSSPVLSFVIPTIRNETVHCDAPNSAGTTMTRTNAAALAV